MKVLNRISLEKRSAVPLLLMAVGLSVLSFFLLVSHWSRLKQAQGMVRSAHVIELISNVIHETQKERAVSTLFLSKKATEQELEEQRKIVDERLRSFTEIVRDFHTEDTAKEEERNKNRLKDVRGLVDSHCAATEAAKAISDLADAWIEVQVRYATRFHLDGREASLVSVAIFEKSKESMGRLRALLNSILGANQPISAAVVSLLSTHRAGILSNLDSPGLTIAPESRRAIEALLASDDWKSAAATFEKVVEHSATGNYDQDAKAFSTTITRVIDGVRSVILSEIGATESLLEQAEGASRRIFWLCLGGAIGLLSLCLAIAYLVVRSITSSLTDVASLLSGGASRVSGIADQLEKASQSLSASTTQQAAALQQTTAAVEETSAMIKRNAENADRSTRLSEQSKTSAAQGQNTVSEMVVSIDEIAGSVSAIVGQIDENNQQMARILNVIGEIGSKTKVINDIVFQTRLLAFNASVEAARAGEHGKGFAVVAEEVGALAQMSGAASKEISTLLEESITNVRGIAEHTKANIEKLVSSATEKVQNGKANATRCGEILEEIVQRVSSVGEMLAEISHASHEQASGIQEINSAMGQLDLSAQQNRQVSQGASASAAELNGQVGDLKNVVHRLNEVVHGSGQRSNIDMPLSDGIFDPAVAHSTQAHAKKQRTSVNSAA
jgi:methyl-accepting chemotaxis protein